MSVTNKIADNLRRRGYGPAQVDQFLKFGLEGVTVVETSRLASLIHNAEEVLDDKVIPSPMAMRLERSLVVVKADMYPYPG
jgi:hypothetical protein